MSYESAAEPIKIGYLMDFRLPDSYPQHMRDDLSLPFELIFGVRPNSPIAITISADCNSCMTPSDGDNGRDGQDEKKHTAGGEALPHTIPTTTTIATTRGSSLASRVGLGRVRRDDHLSAGVGMTLLHYPKQRAMRVVPNRDLRD